jgi:hypothetical protein
MVLHLAGSLQILLELGFYLSWTRIQCARPGANEPGKYCSSHAGRQAKPGKIAEIRDGASTIRQFPMRIANVSSG